jgi:elongation factor G
VIEEDVIPPEVLGSATAKRAELIEQLAEVDEQISDLFLEDAEITTEHIVSAIRRVTIARKFTPVFLGSAVKNTAVQPLLDGVCAYLPDTADVTTTALDLSKPSGEQQIPLVPAVNAPLVALAFKLEEGRYGQLTYMRVYQGLSRKEVGSTTCVTAKRVKVPRLVRMHSDEMEVLPNPSHGGSTVVELKQSFQDVDSIGPGEICAVFGIECASGDTFHGRHHAILDDKHVCSRSCYLPLD